MSVNHFDKDQGTKLKLFTPGPVEVPKRILEELAKPNDTHRSKAYEELHHETTTALQRLLFTRNGCLIFASSASGLMEGCVRNLVNNNEKILTLSIGAFGDRWHEIALNNGKDSTLVAKEWGTALSPEFVEQALSKEKYHVVLLQSNETSTGVYNPLEEILPTIKDHGALACVDATSSMAGVKLEVDKLGIDVCLASVQKCFALPPGIAVCSISDDALQKARQVKNRGYYFDFISMMKKNEVNQTPNTPSIPHIRALRAQLAYILNDEGLDNRFKRHAQLGKRVRMWARDIDIEMFSEKGYESNTVSTMRNNLNLNYSHMISLLLLKGFRIVNGYGQLKDKTFRIGHMGDMTLPELEEMLKHLTDIIAELRIEKME
jgi:aspartate aminotransferase-like enzyme